MEIKILMLSTLFLLSGRVILEDVIWMIELIMVVMLIINHKIVL